MPTRASPPRSALWGLWIFFTAATIGFAVLLGGLGSGEPAATMAGAGLMAFSTLVYLFIHFWSTSQALLASAEPAAPRAVLQATHRTPAGASPANEANFDHLLSHTLERAPEPAPTRTPPVVPPRAKDAPWTETLVVAGGGTENGHARSREHFVPAAQRRNEWIGGLPLIRDVLGEAQPVTHPGKPGKTLGQCSGCQTMLWAPTERPIRLRCPRCGKVAWLEK